MVFRHFRVHIVLRILLITGTAIALAWCIVDGHYLRSLYLGVALAALTAELIWHVDRFNRDVKNFMISLLQNDFTSRYRPVGKSRTFDELYETLNRISDAFRKVNAEKEIQFRYLEMLVENVGVGILSTDSTGHVHIVNQALKDLLGKEVILNVKALASVDPSLPEVLTDIRSGETRLVKVRTATQLLQLSVHASEFRLEGRYYKLVSLQNIRNELDAREMEAWQKLIRILTHEIMNSVSPVISLSETMYDLLRQHEQTLRSDDASLYEKLDAGLDAIKTRSQGLYTFTQSYRKLTGVPRPTMVKSSLRDIVDRVITLVGTTLKERSIDLQVTGTDTEAIVDPALMEHVIINLLLNAIDALAATEQPAIAVNIFRNAEGNACVSIRDNGEGMDEATAEKIFVPFFTTRKNGSGIGLPLSRQILQLHQADITFTSEKGRGTEFVVKL